jgi:kojibiose phosphorylase
VERFASYDDLHLLVQKYIVRGEEPRTIELHTGIDGRVWSLNGEHFRACKPVGSEEYLGMECRTGEFDISIDVMGSYVIEGGTIEDHRLRCEDREMIHEYSIRISPEKPVTLIQYVSVFTSNDTEDPKKSARETVRRAQRLGYQVLKDEHKKRWDTVWDVSDVRIDGDIFSQAALRFNLYQNIIATPAHTDTLPIGARGLSCQAYQGAAFWDQEMFNMPMFLFTQPEVARNILTYRYKTLSGAREKARNLGYTGAFYAWISGKTGEELCPSFFFKDVFTGRPIHNHFNDWQIHVSPDIVYAIKLYYEATGDWEFIVRYGAEIIFEVARFLWSRAHFKKDKNRYEIIRVLGPDEYHENVDNNGFTNYQCRFALSFAESVYQRLKKENPSEYYLVAEKIGLEGTEVDDWCDMQRKLYLPEPDPHNRIIEQFDGFFDLEDTTPEQLERRILDNHEYWGWPNGIAVETQVSKQADVIQLMNLHPLFEKKVVRANFDYYEPRTQHGSSLSPSAYAIAAARIGYIEKAYTYFKEGTTIDLWSTAKAESGGTFIGGIHTAACGAAWQMIVFGFAGMRLAEDELIFEPVLPELWEKVSFTLFYRGNRLTVSFTKESMYVTAYEENPDSVDVRIGCNIVKIGPGSHEIVQYGDLRL